MRRSARWLVDSADGLRDRPPSPMIALLHAIRLVLALQEMTLLSSADCNLGSPSPNFPRLTEKFEAPISWDAM